MKRIRCLPLFIILLLLAGWVNSYHSVRVQTASLAVQPPAYTLILDAGHGGEDGGAVSITGVPESLINLEIVRKMDCVLSFCGVAPVLLRSDDRSLHDTNAVTLREKKVSDLKNRVTIIEHTDGAALISIHQNSYPDGRYRGTQVFYAPTAGSQALAEQLQRKVVHTLQPENMRECKPIPDTVYLLNHVSCPAVLVECGFLTNKEEEQLLQTHSYQKKLAITLCSAWMVHNSKEDSLQLEKKLLE